MATQQNSIALLPWSEQLCHRLLGASTGARYLHSYLDELARLENWNPITALVEGHYVDRHYLDDFQDYYSVSFNTPHAACRRIHFFGRLAPQQVLQLLDDAFRDCANVARVAKTLSDAYLGFVVRRPLAAATLGRTVLRTYPVDGRRHYEVVRDYKVNLLGLSLTVQGLAYQQQDRGAAVCASTALWSALQQVADRTGHRTPTPSAITRAADSPFAASHGLFFAQMADAVSRLGYGADYFHPLHNRARFRAQLVACLESQLPVVLTLNRRRPVAGGRVPEGHAICVTGYSEPAGVQMVGTDFTHVPPVPLFGATASVIYVHDDNLGFHAHYELRDSTDVDDQGYPKLQILRGRSNQPPPPWWTPDVWDVDGALVPKPKKLRKSVSGLFLDLVFLRPVIARFFRGAPFTYRMRFDSGTAYRRRLLEGEPPVDRTHLPLFQAIAAFPRHIGVVSLSFGPARAIDLVLDATEVERDPQNPIVLAVVAPIIPSNSPAAIAAVHLSHLLRCPLLLGPRAAVRPRVIPVGPALPTGGGAGGPPPLLPPAAPP